MQILKRAKNAEMEIIPITESESNVREEVNRRSWKAGYTDRDGQQMTSRKTDAGKGDSPRPVTQKYYDTMKRLFGEPKLNTWPRDEQGNLID